MSDIKASVKEGVKGFFKGDIATKLIVLIIVAIIAGTYIYTEERSNEQNNKTLEEMKKTNENIEGLLVQFLNKQAEVNELTECINDKHNEAIDIFNDDFSIVLGETLEGVGLVPFPQKLNQAFNKFKKKFVVEMKDCLINPARAR